MEAYDACDESGPHLLHMMQAMFVQRNRDKFSEIKQAAESGDTALAHRLAHTLKGSAGQIGQAGLREAAAKIENLLRAGARTIPEELMELLETELALALEELAPLLNRPERETEPPDAGRASVLFEKLESMFADFDPGCFDLLDELRAIPGTEGLVYQIEEYDLKAAAKTLAGLKEKRGQGYGS